MHVTDQTEIEQEDNPIAVGDLVEVKGLAESDGSITASKIEAENENEAPDEDTVALTGSAQSIPATVHHVGMWKVSHHAVRMFSTTVIVKNGHRLRRGAHLRVRGRWLANGTIRAARIVVLS